MRPATSLHFKLATEAWEFEAIHRLNYRTFVEEIPQHPPNPEGRLVDRFHAENRYVIAIQDDRLVGMIAVRGQRPFSLDAKVPDLDAHLPRNRKPVEARLLAVEPAFRRTRVFVALFEYTARECLNAGFDLVVISGTTRQLKLYSHLGFTPFGPLVGPAGATYQPMFLTLEGFQRTSLQSPALRRTFPAAPCPSPSRPVNLLPGPVLTTPEVDAALAAPAISHRSAAFQSQLLAVRRQLCALTGARQVQVIPGSGSLANAVVAAQLRTPPTTGLILSNGEFGDRLVRHARQAGLAFDRLTAPWGQAFRPAEIEAALHRLPPGGWVWWVHHETSTGLLNPLDEFKPLAAERNLRLCVDVVSSLGAVPVDLRGIHLASSSSGKGLGAYPGLALVFHAETPAPQPDALPDYLDLGHWAAHESVPHTHSSNLVGALTAALRQGGSARHERIRYHATWLRRRLLEQGWCIVAPEEHACPAVLTLALDRSAGSDSNELAARLEHEGYWLNAGSAHLIARNWIQISLLGDPSRETLEGLCQALARSRPFAAARVA